MEQEHRRALTLLFNPETQRRLSNDDIHIMPGGFALTRLDGADARQGPRQDHADAQIDGGMQETSHPSSPAPLLQRLVAFRAEELIDLFKHNAL